MVVNNFLLFRTRRIHYTLNAESNIGAVAWAHRVKSAKLNEECVCVGGGGERGCVCVYGGHNSLGLAYHIFKLLLLIVPEAKSEHKHERSTDSPL